MKNFNMKLLITCFIIAFLAMNSFGQNTVISSQTDEKQPEKLDVKKVPKVVVEAFTVEFPNPTFVNWYGYPSFKEKSDWYCYNPFLCTVENPENYIVVYTLRNEKNKIIYDKTGKKIATHKKLNSELPQEVISAISNSEYKSWTIAKDKEELVNEADKAIIYKVIVFKGNKKHILYYQPDGKLVKDLKLP